MINVNKWLNCLQRYHFHLIWRSRLYITLIFHQSYSEVDSENSYKYYDLLAIIAHYGQGVIFGHYLSIIKIEGKWFIFDDDQIQVIY